MSNSSIWDAGSVFAMGLAPDGGSPWVQFVPFAIVLAIFYFIILLPMKRKQQKVSQFLESLKVNDRIVTTGGIYGQITRLGDQNVQVSLLTTPSGAWCWPRSLSGRHDSRRP